MKVAISNEPLKTSYRIQGTGIYTQQLLKVLKKNFGKDEFIEFSRLEELKKDVDVIHYPYFNPFFLTLPLKKLFPTVITVHDLIPLVFPRYFPVGFRGNFKWTIQQLSLRGVSAIIADSKVSKDDIVRFTGIEEKKISVIYLAAREEFKKITEQSVKLKRIKKKYNLPDKFVLHVGDIIWSKNIPNLIRAIKKLGIVLVMVGKQTTMVDFDRNHPWNRDLVLFNNLVGEARQVVRLGFVPNEELVALFNLATVFVMPSFYEGFGLPVLEAMACSCPVVTTKGGSLPEVAGEAAIYVDPYDVDSIADGIASVYDGKDIQRKLIQKGLKQVQNFSWGKTASQTRDIYKNVIC